MKATPHAEKVALWAHSSAVEHLTFNQRVVGSNPAGLTNFFNDLTQKQIDARLFLDSKLVLRCREKPSCAMFIFGMFAPWIVGQPATVANHRVLTRQAIRIEMMAQPSLELAKGRETNLVRPIKVAAPLLAFLLSSQQK